MRLNECLNHASVPTLQRIAKSLHVACVPYSKLDILQSILEAWLDPDARKTMVHRWCADWDAAMRRIVLLPRHAFAREEMASLLAPYGDGAVDRALEAGWLYVHPDPATKFPLIVPEDVCQACHAHYVANWRSKVAMRSDDPPCVLDEEDAILADLETLVAYVRDHDVRLTTTGALYKRNLEQVMQLFKIEESLELPRWRFGYGKRTFAYPDRLALVYDFACDEGLLIEHDGRVEVDDARWHAWKSRLTVVKLRRLLRHYVISYRGPIPRLPDVLRLILRLGDDWLHLDSLYDLCLPFLNPFYYDSMSDVWRTRIVKMLVHLGIARLGSDAPECPPEWFQTTELGQELLSRGDEESTADLIERRPALVVQPNFELVVVSPDPRLEETLAPFVERIPSDGVRAYRVLAHTVAQGVRAGHDFDAWRACVARHALYGIPQNVDRMLVRWAEAARLELEAHDVEPGESWA
ncbi:hypothetical protein IW967_06165 [Alicyclobacillus mali]|uniref:Helicase conserved C-terminal domain-containing protein n=1 Tax=Alicyclobacillus mali (ex Roth et al. 2021) TaxID=1123961 RepID=A0ABS0F2H2_9BACL|nr:hypothetical protein [Alicyclobacillus mali (ex Roth et al. 2021)]MBF8377459.1 hypothetical protein [Alicyclobacillus mali (ex Roth et al. 2021)]MCL6487427.1 helicase-associated domain-containing protein [Alicyclobacillus mali (ex Roth et al. 2021)]